LRIDNQDDSGNKGNFKGLLDDSSRRLKLVSWTIDNAQKPSSQLNDDIQEALTEFLIVIILRNCLGNARSIVFCPAGSLAPASSESVQKSITAK
jgi:hypothetical protein